MRSLVSIIVPVYNVEKYLNQCIDSLLNQTLKDIEIILVNDGSTDNCRAICDRYAEQDKRVRVIHQKNSGYGKACNNGIKAAGSDYFGIVEPDDFTEPNMYERLYNTVKEHELDAVRCHYYFYNSDKKTDERVDLSFIPRNTVYSPGDNNETFRQAAAVWAMLYRMTFIRDNGIQFPETPGASYQDLSFAYKVHALSNKYMLIDDTLIHYRTDNKNSSMNSKEKMYCVCDEYAEIIRFSKEKNIYDKMKYIITRNKLLSYMWNFNRLDSKKALIFLKTASKEMRGHIRQKETDKKLFKNREFLKLYMIAYAYQLYYFAKLIKKRITGT